MWWSLFLITLRLQHRCFPTQAASETKHIHASAADLLHIRIGNLDWNESHEKDTKQFMLQLSIYCILEYEIWIGENADIAKTK